MWDKLLNNPTLPLNKVYLLSADDSSVTHFWIRRNPLFTFSEYVKLYMWGSWTVPSSFSCQKKGKRKTMSSSLSSYDFFTFLFAMLILPKCHGWGRPTENLYYSHCYFHVVVGISSHTVIYCHPFVDNINFILLISVSATNPMYL